MDRQEEKGLRRKGWKGRWREIIVLMFLCLVAGYFFSSCEGRATKKPETKDPSVTVFQNAIPSDTMDDVDFTKFRHDSMRHKDMPCLLCHQRNDNETKPKLSGHTPCAACHAPQFKDSEHPICTICHVAKGSAEVKPFPPLKSMSVMFNHSAHFKETNCTTCHSRQGDGMTVPAGSTAHQTCFECHTFDRVIGERNIGSCATCHQRGTEGRISDSTQPIGYNFDHGKHSGVDCRSCHNPISTNKMSVINVGMHGGEANSCAQCHNGQRAFGANSFANCRRCHDGAPAMKNAGVDFSHQVHAGKDCKTCHTSGKSAVTFNVPNSQSAHNTCFQCHNPMKGGAKFTDGKCFTCHQPGGGNDIQAAAPTIPGNFSHSKHGSMNCATCHNPSGMKMTAPTAVMHQSAPAMSCATCHNNKRAFGEDFNNCKKCHVTGGFGFQ